MSDFVDLFPFLIFIYLTFNFNAGEYTKKIKFLKKCGKFIARRSPKLNLCQLFKINSLLNLKIYSYVILLQIKLNLCCLFKN